VVNVMLAATKSAATAPRHATGTRPLVRRGAKTDPNIVPPVNGTRATDG
jgi:hypothetical protein